MIWAASSARSSLHEWPVWTPARSQTRCRGGGSTSAQRSPSNNQFDSEVRDVHPLVRLSPHYYNTDAEIDQAVAAVAALAVNRS